MEFGRHFDASTIVISPDKVKSDNSLASPEPDRGRKRESDLKDPYNAFILKSIEKKAASLNGRGSRSTSAERPLEEKVKESEQPDTVRWISMKQEIKDEVAKKLKPREHINKTLDTLFKFSATF